VSVKVVELLLAKGANKEHRNISDYTPLSQAASGGYVNVIKVLLAHSAEINSRSVVLAMSTTISSQFSTVTCHVLVAARGFKNRYAVMYYSDMIILSVSHEIDYCLFFVNWVNVSSGTGSPGLSRTKSTEP